MATSSFFYGSSPAPEQNTINELIADLEAKVAVAQEASNSAAISAADAKAASDGAKASENSVSALLVQAQATLVAAVTAQQAAENALIQAQSALVEVEADRVAADAARVAAQAAQALAETANTNAQSAKTAAQASATAAAASQSAAATSATNAATSASSASSSASTATTQATNASSSATAAAGSATTATTQASNAATSATNASNSATTATTQAGIATTKASEASASATSAASSATTATTQATNASTSASNAASSATAAAGSASAASTSATNAANSATAASTSATNASNSASAALASQNAAASSASSASTSATNASNSASAASTSATNAASSATAAAASFDEFDDRYLGAKSSAPTVDNDGNALLTGALYYDTTISRMRFYTGSAWSTIETGITQADGDNRYALQTNPTLNGNVTTTGLNFDSNTFVIDATNNRVGVGTASPSSTFTVFEAGAPLVSVIGDNTQEGQLLFNNTTAARIHTINSVPMIIGTVNTERMRIDTAGNVGIGTSSPSTRLEIAVSSGSVSQARQFLQASGSAAAAEYMRITNTGGDGVFGVADSGGTGIVAGGLTYATQLYTVGATALQFGTNSNVRATIDSSGNLGIGTTSQTERLQVEGVVKSSSSGNLSSGAGAHLYYTSGTSSAELVALNPGVAWLNQTYKALSHQFSISGTERMRLDSSGNLGIGTSSPGYRLHVSQAGAPQIGITGNNTAEGQLLFTDITAGRISTTNATPLLLATNGSERIRVESGGNVGIGTSTPTSGYRLDVAGNFKVSGSIDENIFAVSGTAPALSPQNGTIQTWTLSGNSAPTSGTWNAGESLTLMVLDGTAFTITWTSLAVTWVGGTAPTLDTTKYTVIELWKVGSVIYGALVGAA